MSSKHERQLRIPQFCYRFNNRNKPCTAQHQCRAPGNFPHLQGTISVSSSEADAEPSMASPLDGIQRCFALHTSSQGIWQCMHLEEKIALQSTAFFIRSDLHWYIADKPMWDPQLSLALHSRPQLRFFLVMHRHRQHRHRTQYVLRLRVWGGLPHAARQGRLTRLGSSDFLQYRQRITHQAFRYGMHSMQAPQLRLAARYSFFSCPLCNVRQSSQELPSISMTGIACCQIHLSGQGLQHQHCDYFIGQDLRSARIAVARTA